MEIQNQTKAQFESLHGGPSKQAKTSRACFDILFNDITRVEASANHGVSAASISSFIRTNEHKHNEIYRYVDNGNNNTD